MRRKLPAALALLWHGYIVAHEPDNHDDGDPLGLYQSGYWSHWEDRDKACDRSLPTWGECEGESIDLPVVECIAWQEFFCGLENWETATRHYHNQSMNAVRSCVGLGRDPCACRYADANNHLRGVACVSDPHAHEPLAHISQL